MMTRVECIPRLRPMLGGLCRDSFRVRENARKMRFEVPHVPGQDDLALSVQRVRDVHPVRDYCFPSLDQFGSGWLTKAAGLGQVGRDPRYPGTNSA